MTPSLLNIVITKKADGDEELIYKYIARKFGKQYADNFRKKIIELFKALAITPLAGRFAKNNRSVRVFIFSRQNKIVYKPTVTDIIILRILNTKTKTARKY